MAFMLPNQQPTWRSQTVSARFRSGSPFILVFLMYAAAVAGSLYIVERFYQEAKWEIIQQKINTEHYIKADVTPATKASEQYLRELLRFRNLQETAPQRALEFQLSKDAALERARELAKEFVLEAPVISALELRLIDGELIFRVEDEDAIRRQHDWTNRLLTRNFQRTGKRSFPAMIDGQEQQFAAWTIYITTARGDQDIMELTVRYWQVILIVCSFFSILAWALLRFTFAPLRRVMLYMERKNDASPAIITDARNSLERAYNSLARDAALTRLSKELRDRISTRGISYAEPILEELPSLLDEILLIPTAQVWTFYRKGENHAWVLDRCFSLPIPWVENGHFGHKLCAMLAAADPSEDLSPWLGRVHHETEAGQPTRPWFSDLLDMREDHFWLLVIQGQPGAAAPPDFWADYFTRIATETRYALSSVEEQRRLILQEKSKANISLSRNLGHDLTNIIATSKLELMTVKTILSQGYEALQKNPAKEKIFRESLEALLNNTRFLQEIVNLYRSFSYLQKPKFEEIDVNGLVEDVGQLYRLTLSKSFKIVVNTERDLPTLTVEPRLLRLALFNILTNAVDAIKRSSTGEAPEGEVMITTRLLPRRQMLEISVEDTGPGIRDAAGQLLSHDAIMDIFRLGYTTKANQEGEGLGLNWVQSIVREFHGGEVAAANREQGGAAFFLRIPLARDHGALPSSGEIPAATLVQMHQNAASEGEAL